MDKDKEFEVWWEDASIYLDVKLKRDSWISDWKETFKHVWDIGNSLGYTEGFYKGADINASKYERG